MSVNGARLPWLSAGFVVVAAVVSVWPEAGEALAYRRASTEGAGAWRALTGQLVHGTVPMALADLGVIALCGTFLERRRRGLALGAGLAGLLAVGITVHASPQVMYFDGSSGVAAALFAASALWLALTSRSSASRVLAGLGLVLLVAKAGLEQWGGGYLSGVSLPEGASVLPAAHLAGSVAGACAAAWAAVVSRADRC